MDDLAKLAGLVAALIAAYKVIVDVVLARSSKHREEYQFAKDYLVDLHREEVHCFIKEKGFKAIAGASSSVEEIKHLLSYRRPTEAINLRLSAKSIVRFRPDSDDYQWTGWYNARWFRALSPNFYLLSYVFFAFLGLSPIFLGSKVAIGGLAELIFSVSLLVIAIAFLLRRLDIQHALEFIRLQPG